MANVTAGKRDVTKLAELLDAGEFESAEDMARYALEQSFQIYEAKSKYVIVAILAATDGEDREGRILAIGPYGTPAKARDAISSMAMATETETRWLVQLDTRTPNQILTEKRKERQAQADEERDTGRLAWLLPLKERDALIADLNALVDGRMSLDELKEAYPDSGWEPALVGS